VRERTALLFSAVVVVMAGHEGEHVAQLGQKHALGATCPNDCRGLLGFAFDLEWVHFAYNTSILAVLVALYAWGRLWRGPRTWGWSALSAGIAVQGYHVIEHTQKLLQWLANGHRAGTPGILGHHAPLVELHFALNTLVFALVVAGYLGLGCHRVLWRSRTPARVAAAVAVLVLATVATGFGWEQRPPTVRLAAGVHQGPIVLDRPSRLVGEPGTVVRGGIIIRSNDVIVRDLAVLGGENGIEVRDAEGVVLERVRISSATMDGISARRSSVTVRGCRIDTPRTAGAQGIDISFASTRPPSTVSRCVVRGGSEGIVSHMAAVVFKGNDIHGTSLRGIAVTEMSMGSVERNTVTGALGVGIFCGDFSHCSIEDNRVGTVGIDPSGNPTRAGFGLVAHYGAVATVARNALERAPASFIGARIEHP